MLVMLVLLSGCSRAIRVTELTIPPRTLTAVNARLVATPRAVVWLTDGQRIVDATHVRVGADDVRFLVDGEPLAVPTARVERVTTDAGTRAVEWAGLGAAPGLALAGLTVLAAVSGEATEGVGAAIALGIGIYGGVGFGFVGALIGNAAGSQVPAGVSEVIYQGPIDRYPAARGDMP